MPMPSIIRKFNRRFINPRVVEKESWPILVHQGRTSGAEYRTPVGVEPTEDGYAVFLVYGSERTDWVKNVMAAGEARLRIEGRTERLGQPRIVPIDEARGRLGDDVRFPPGFAGVHEVLLLDRV